MRFGEAVLESLSGGQWFAELLAMAQVFDRVLDGAVESADDLCGDGDAPPVPQRRTGRWSQPAFCRPGNSGERETERARNRCGFVDPRHHNFITIQHEQQFRVLTVPNRPPTLAARHGDARCRPVAQQCRCDEQPQRDIGTRRVARRLFGDELCAETAGRRLRPHVQVALAGERVEQLVVVALAPYHVGACSAALFGEDGANRVDDRLLIVIECEVHGYDLGSFRTRLAMRFNCTSVEPAVTPDDNAG